MPNNQTHDLHQLIIVTVYAIFKNLDLVASNPMHVWYARIFFGVGNLFFFLLFVKTSWDIENCVAAKEQKIAARLEVLKLFGNLLFRAALVAFVHYRSNILQPLVISLVMGIFPLLENRDTCNELLHFMPLLKRLNKQA